MAAAIAASAMPSGEAMASSVLSMASGDVVLGEFKFAALQ